MQSKAGIFPKFQLPYFILLLATLGVLALLLWPLPKAQQAQRAQQQGLALSMQLISPQLAVDLLDYNLLAMQTRLQPLIEHPWVQSVQLLDQDQRLVIQLGQPEQGLWLEHSIQLNQQQRGLMRVQLPSPVSEFWLDNAARLTLFFACGLALFLMLQLRINWLTRLNRQQLLQPLSGHINAQQMSQLLEGTQLSSLREQWLPYLKLAATAQKHLSGHDVLTLRRLMALPSKETWQGTLIVVKIDNPGNIALEPCLKQLLPLYDGYHCPLTNNLFFGLNGHIEDSLWSAICVCYIIKLIYPKDSLSQAIDLDQATLKPDSFAGLPLWRMQGAFDQRLPWFLQCSPADGIMIREQLFNHIDGDRIECSMVRDLSLPDQSHELWLLETIKSPYNSLLQKQAEHILACITLQDSSF